LGLLAALRFLTVIPTFSRREDSPAEMGQAVVYYPVVGLAIGLVLAGLNWLFGLFLPSEVANILLIVALVMISGALHLDGFVDTFDGIAGHKPVEARWQVMRDSRVGAFGVVGVVLLLLVKYVSLNSLPGALLMVSLVLMPLISRWTMVYALFAYPYARPDGLGKALKQGTGWSRFIIATAVTLAFTVGLAWLAGMTYFYLVGPAIMLGSWVVIVGVAGYLKGKFAGLTGDTYGAINEIAEVGVLILIGLLAHNDWLL
jgi:adenosylcobinamide-GDP ribazoletransferase